MKKIVVNLITNDMHMDYSIKEAYEDLSEYDVDIYETKKIFDRELADTGYQENIDKNIFLNETENDFVIPFPCKSKPLRDFATAIDAVNKEEIDVLLLAGKVSTYIDEVQYETNEQLLRAVLERYCDLKSESQRMFKYPIEYIQNIMASSAPYVEQYVDYAGEVGVANPVIGYSRKFAKLFNFREDITPNNIINTHDILMTAFREKLKVKYLRSRNFREEHLSMSDMINIDIWEYHNDKWKTDMKRAIPKFSKNITRRKIEFIE